VLPADGFTLFYSDYGTGSFNLDNNGTVQDVNGVIGNNIAYTGVGNALSMFTVTVQPVPEPSSMILGGCLMAGMGFGGYRRRKAALLAKGDVA